VAIAKKLGFVVGNAELNDDIDGFIIVDEDKDEILGINTSRLIGVNASKSLEWKRFIIAHEIGHYKLHYNRKADNGMYAHREHKTGKNEKENEADFFAANLLMPSGRFKNKYNDLKEKGLSIEEIIVLLAEKFVVTRHMAERRIKELSLLE
jgi:Zn-dependent peptidase ImmA (M78 family)